MAVGPTSYTIRNGDTLSALAKRFNTTVDALAKANNIKNVDQILTGGTLTIPGKSDDFKSFNRPSIKTFLSGAGQKKHLTQGTESHELVRSTTGETKLDPARTSLENGVSNVRTSQASSNTVAEAQKWVGFHEGGKNGAGNVNPFSKHFKRPPEFWCADFASYCLEKGGRPAGKVGVGFASTKEMANWYKQQGKFSQTPHVGDPVFLHEGGRKDNPNGINHVGIVSKIDKDGTIHTIEGNSGNQVKERVYKPNDPRIMGYGNDVSGGKTTTPVKTRPAPVTPQETQSPEQQVLNDAKEIVDDLRNGDMGELVKDLGRLLGNAGRIGLPDPVLQKPQPIVGGAEGKLEPTKTTTSKPTKGKTDLSGITSNKGYDANKYDSIINEMAAKYGVPPRLLKAQMKQESQFNPNARSPKGAAGLIQLMPGTAKEMGVKNPYDPRQNIEGAAKYMSQMLKLTKGNIPEALAAYNAGPGNYQKYKGIPPFKETQTYVRNIMETYNKA